MEKQVPTSAFSPRSGVLRSLMGDSRTLLANQTALVIDVEFETPRALLIVITAVNSATGAPVTVAISTRTGVERGQIDSEDINRTGFERAVLARSVSVSINNSVSGVTADIRAVVVPLDITADASIFGSSSLGPDLIVNPAIGAFNYVPLQIPVDVISTFIGSASLGFTAYNYSPAGRSMALLLGPILVPPVNPVVSFANFTVIVPPMSYWTPPQDWRGMAISVIWDAADAAGFGAFTFRA